jgi:predicted AAA+ superfamily ATPase
MEIRSRFLTLPDQSAFLFGPRGTGKTTWLHHSIGEALFVDLLQPDRFRELSARPERLRELVLATAEDRPVVIDEIQRVPELLNVVHELVELQRNRRVIMTGSSARKLRRGGVDLLAGRAVMRRLHPFMAAELPEFEVSSALETGMLPLVLGSREAADTLRAYATLYLEEEVRVEGLVRNVGNFARFLEAISFSHAGVLNVANVARECQVERRTAVGYLGVLQDLLLCFRLPAFARRAHRPPRAHPKFYYFDAGVYRSLRPRGPLDRPEEIDGAALEGLVAQHLRAWIDYSQNGFRLFYWRSRSYEVDFVLYGEEGFCALEVKNTGEVRARDVRGLQSFRSEYPECETLLLYRGGDRLRIGAVTCVPVEEFLRELRPSRPLIDR